MTVGDLKKILVDYSDTDNITVLTYKLEKCFIQEVSSGPDGLVLQTGLVSVSAKRERDALKKKLIEEGKIAAPKKRGRPKGSTDKTKRKKATSITKSLSELKKIDRMTDEQVEQFREQQFEYGKLGGRPTSKEK